VGNDTLVRIRSHRRIARVLPNPGLDASSALAYTEAIRTLTDVLGLTTIVTLYQAGNQIFDLFDKVLLLDVGKQIYYGPRSESQRFFEDLGFEYTEGANVADFLTGVFVPTERKIKPGFESTCPRTADAIREVYQKSETYAVMRAELGYSTSEEAKRNTTDFKDSVIADRDNSLPKHSVLTVGIGAQILVLARRQYQMILGNWIALAVRLGSTLVQALVAGSLFYNISDTANGLFLFGGTLFFSVLYNS
jgi:ATP-binding cassette subfamily G (WHITE) protein 2 (SNQ2)